MSHHDEPGRAAIDAALDAHYDEDAEDYRFGIQAERGEEEAPLAEVVAFHATHPVPHWHYTTYGLTELGPKVSSDALVSGFGVEYTLRLVSDAAGPPTWPINLLRWLATLVWATREPMDPSHSMNLPPNFLDAVSPGVEGLGFVEDFALRSVHTENGRLRFVQIFPLMHREYWLLGAWDFHKFMARLVSQEGDALWRTQRKSLLEGEAGAALLAEVEREGSQQGLDFTRITWNPGELHLDAVSSKVVVKFLRHRLAYGREATVVHGERRVVLTPGAWSLVTEENTCTMHVPQTEAAALADELENAKHDARIERAGGVRVRVSHELL